MGHIGVDGLTAIVTGAASGVGRAIAQELSEDGAVVIGCDVNDVAGEREMAAISGTYRHVDVSREAEVAALVDAVVATHGRLDIMVNNAAIQVAATVLDTTEEELDRVLSVNLKGPFFGVKHAIRAMSATGGGAIVNISSVLGLVADGDLAAYGAAKAGVLGVTRAAAVQFGSIGIRCNAICPGDIETPLVAEFFNLRDDPAAARAEITALYPMQRIADPSDVAKLAVFLASPDASYITGQAFVIDGGLLAKVY